MNSIMRRVILLNIVVVCAGDVFAQQDPTLAAMIEVYSNKAKREYEEQEEIMLLISEGHIWTEEEVEATVDLIKEYNSYLDSFRSIICFAAESYGLYYEVGAFCTTMQSFNNQVKKTPLNAVAVALSAKRNSIYKDLLLTTLDICNDIRDVCLSDNKMTEKERMEIIFSIRPKLKKMNKKFRQLVKTIKYTTLNDVWLEISEGSYPMANKKDIAEAAHRRWRQIGKDVRP